MNSPQLQRGVFLALLAIVTVAFLWVLMPFFGAVLWGVALAILFTPLYKWLLRKMPGRRNAAALSTLTICLFIVILPLAMAKMKAVQAAVLVMEKEGVTQAFGVPGAAINPMYSALRQRGTISHILARHVEGASHMKRRRMAGDVMR